MTIMRKRHLRAVLLLLVLAGHSVATLGSADAGPTCSMCSRVCCCAPKGAFGSCRLERPCGRGARAPEAGLRLVENQAVLEVAGDFLPIEPAGRLTLASLMRVLDLVRTPPDPPPRLLS